MNARRRLPRRRERAGAARLERQLPQKRPVERHAEAELIGARVRLAVELLGRHEGRRAHDRSVFGQRRRQRMARGRRRRGQVGRRGLAATLEGDQPEVGHLHPTIPADEQVGRLDVAMNEADRVCGGEPAPGIEEGGDDLASARPLVLEPLGHRRALDEPHGDEHLPAFVADVVDGDHVRMRQARHRLRLAEQALAARAHDRSAQDLERDLAIELRVVGGVDGRHAAFAEHIEDEIAADGPPDGKRTMGAGRAAQVGRLLGRRRVTPARSGRLGAAAVTAGQVADDFGGAQRGQAASAIRFELLVVRAVHSSAYCTPMLQCIARSTSGRAGDSTRWTRWRLD